MLLTKTHKADETVRPIVDFRNTTLYNLEKILKQKLKIYQNSKFAIYNTDKLLYDIKQIDIKDTYRIASLDIIDMYPSIIWEIIEPKLTQHKIEPEIIDLIEFTYRSNYFEINSKYYTQNSGISMGSVIGPKLAEIIMIDIDKEISDIYGIKFYRRYVDDVLIIYDEVEINTNEIRNIINNIHKNIQFKIEEEDKITNSINYLDITIKRNNTNLEFEPFKKQCSINTTVNYNSNIPIHIKQNIFNMEYTKIKNRTSINTKQIEHLNTLKKKFILSGYPNRILNIWETEIDKKTDKTIRIDPKQAEIKYIRFPYIKGLYEEVNKEVKKINVKLVPTYDKLLSRLNAKQVNKTNITNKEESKNVVYKIPCTCENKKFYIGETKRKVKVRLKEHIADLKYRRLNSAFHEHCLLNNCNIDKNNIDILHRERDTYKRKFKESIEIIKNQNSINKNPSISINENWLKILY
ncbi:uncharacterized protein LOC111636030 [Centruroides sculpturatus]|uniref:uncharacterized protein LOC111636030 n=1 Tax=Centruroides sculpturatus TaxID=218467 RepID=UPI000C6E4D83|nr:uncharacterized protein LOC111636030 [Centruroides sculpturatus]XP_023236950.1 uncharacterized protein LOC111636030 [Centruroides sculpturatus]XP_023236951.1 uncharacterized protein LOC111636030 [Centruroides sculpturatus]